MTARNHISWAAWALFTILTPFLTTANEFDCGIFAARGTGGAGETRTTAAGPLYERFDNPDGSALLAVHPFFSKHSSPLFERTRYEYFWPLCTVRRFKCQRNWNFLILAHGINFDTENPASPYRIRVLPIYFQGRNSTGTDYLGIFPLGGRIYDILGRDEVSFVLFPLWMQHSVNDLNTTSWLWPIISRTSGPGVSRFRVFPFYGVSSKAERYRKRFILWPIWTEAEWFTPGESGSGFLLFPLFGHTKTELEQTWNLIPPFFRFTRGSKRDLTYAPWPIFQRVSGDDIDKLYIWPLWGYRRSEGETKTFLLWPLYQRQQLTAGDIRKSRSMLIPFYYDFERARLLEDDERETESRYLKIWPLFSYENADGQREFNTLALWPGRDLGPIERNWAPLWRIYTRRSSAERFRSELLWGIYRHSRDGEEQSSTTVFPLFSRERDGEKRGWAILNGLAGSVKNGNKRSWQFLYVFKFGKTEAEK
jgi:hypothetical protein